MERKREMRPKWLLGIAVFSACATTCCAQYRVLPGKADSDGCEPATPARICLGATGDAHCYAPPNDKFEAPSNEAYIFGLEPNAKVVGHLDGKELTLFTAMFSGCGSGTLTHFSLLTVRDGEFVNLLPKVELTNVSEFKLWNLPQFSNLPIFVTADFIWRTGETHFERHRYEIEVYVFDSKSHVYVERVHFDTKRKYSGGDADVVNALEGERPIILVKLRQTLSH